MWFGWTGHAGQTSFDPQFGSAFQWDVDLVGGYRSVVLPNWSQNPERGGPWSRVSPAVMTRLVQDEPDGVIVVGHGTVTAVLALLVSRWRRIPTILYGDYAEAARKWTAPLRRIVVRLASVGGAISDRNAGLYEDAAFHPSEIVRIPFGVDNAQFSGIREKVSGKCGRPIVIVPAKLVPWKGHEVAFQAMSRLRPDERPLLAIAGSGPLEKELRARAQTLGIEADLRWDGMLNYSEMPQAYADASAALLPSYREAWGLVLNEAMAGGRAVIVSDACGAARELVCDGVNGRLFPCGDANALAGILSSVRLNPEVWHQMGNTAARTIEKFDVRMAARAFVDVFAAELA